MAARTATVLALLLAAVLAGASPASASLAGEVAAGRQVAQQVDAGQTRCSKLSDADFEHLGEYVMERMLGSRSAHAAMNEQMTAMLDPAGADRMHELMGRRYAGCAVAGSGTAMGPGMMGAGAGGAAMMGSASLAWMRDGAWRHMNRADWQRVRSDWMGPGMMGGRHHGWSALAVIALIAGALLLGALIALAAVRKPWRREPPAAPSVPA